MAEQNETPVAPATQPSTLDSMNEAFAEALKAEGIVKSDNPPVEKKAETPTPPAETKPAEPQKTEPPPVAPEKSWEKLIAEKAALRREQEALKSSPQLAIPNAQALAKAVQSGDALGAIAALGFTYADVTKQLLATPDAPPARQAKQEEPSPSNLPPEVQTRLQRLDQLEAWALQQQRKDILSQVKSAIPPDKFKLVAGREDYERVLGFLEHFHAQTGSLPADSFQDSVLVAAEALERQLAQEAEKWKRVLTPAQPPATIQPEAQRESPPQSGSVTGQPVRTLTNSVTAPAATKTEPQSREEIIQALLKDPEFANNL